MMYNPFPAAAIGLILILAIGGIIVEIFYLLSLQKALEQVSPDLRRMSPGQVWLMLIPFFNIVWNFLMVGHIADSLGAEFQRRNIPVKEVRPGYQVGIAMCILGICGIIPVLGGLAALGALVLWIIYWVKIAGYRKQLEQSNFMGGPFPQYPPSTPPPPPGQGFGNNPF